MNFTPVDLEQYTPERIAQLDSEQSRYLLTALLADLREAHDRLNQNAHNSSRPSGSLPVWAKDAAQGVDDADEKSSETGDDAGVPNAPPTPPDGSESSPDSAVSSPDQEQTNATDDASSDTSDDPDKKPKRNPGRQKGTTGYGGRTQKLPITDEQIHYPEQCSCCGEPLNPERFSARMGHFTLDVERRGEGETQLGLQLSNIKHIYGEIECERCGHISKTAPQVAEDDPEWTVKMSEWHLVGPLLASLIVFLRLRMRLSCARTQEFLAIWLDLYLSTATINQTVHEMGRAVEPLEDELVHSVQQCALVHVDETAWLEAGELLWLWVFVSADTCLYQIGYRTAEFLDHILSDTFSGWLMSDGYQAYRRFFKRLRCWAHLLRKAVGIAESSDPQVRGFGKEVYALLSELIDAVYQARLKPPDIPLEVAWQARLAQFRKQCETVAETDHAKTRALAREFLNDWEAIWAILADPALPLTNNLAERALRHWVIARRISYGTRTPQGTRAYGLLASIIDTCRLRKADPWSYLSTVLTARRKGQAAPSLPQSAACEAGG